MSSTLAGGLSLLAGSVAKTQVAKPIGTSAWAVVTGLVPLTVRLLDDPRESTIYVAANAAGPVEVGWPVLVEIQKNRVTLRSSPNASTGNVRGAGGRQYAMIAGAVRKVGSSWELISDAAHRPQGISSVSTTSTSIRISHATPAGKRISRVVSLVVAPDETLAIEGISAGASVGLTYSDINLGTERPLTDYVSWDSTISNWRVNNGTFTLTYDTANNQLICSHPTEVMSREAVAVAGLVGGNSPFVSGVLGSLTTTQIGIQWITSAGALVVGKTNGCKVFLTRFGARKVNPATLATTGNLWINGVLELE